MLTRLAACFVSLGLLGSAAAHGSFAERPAETRIVIREVAPERAAVVEALQKRRAKNLAAFRAYRKAGVFPRNITRVGPLNVWIDGEGHLCAAATMISKDGKHPLVLEIAQRNNFIRLQNVTEGPLLEWMLTSGFTFEEIDRIQAPAIFPDDMQVVAPDWAAEDARLTKLYIEVDRSLVKGAKQSLEVAVDRVMQNPKLAKRLVAGTL